MAQSGGAFFKTWEEKIRPLIDVIDELRFTDIKRDLALPSIAVIGDQSSGKSSVLETLSGVALPRGTGIVTRCPLMLRLRKHLAGHHPWKGIISYRDQSTDFTDPSLVEDFVKHAQIELAGDGVGICEELISLEIMSPEVCDLTLIDLPGIARVPVRGQPDDIADQIKRLILSFIKKSETIILVVVPCNVDIATTEALKMAQEVDPEGERTLAILTKPDLVDPGAEQNVLDIVENRVIPLSKGYIVVKCRGQQDIQNRTPLAEATRKEREFFEDHKHFKRLLNEERATTQCLATKLSQDLIEHIKKVLPALSEQINQELFESRRSLSECIDGPPKEPAERRTYLIKRLMLFTGKITNLSAGEVVIGEKNLFVILRHHFQEWSDRLQSSREPYAMILQNVKQQYDERFRGRELPGFRTSGLQQLQETIQEQLTDVSEECFSNYPNLRCIAMNKIEQIQSKQEGRVMKRIKEQFEMEKLVYTQDSIYKRTLKENDESFSNSDTWDDYDERNRYPRNLQAYYEIVIQRLADQIPMLIQFFLLKESVRVLCEEMLDLQLDLDEALWENSDASRRRNNLQSRIERLSLVQGKLNHFIGHSTKLVPFTSLRLT